MGHPPVPGDSLWQLVELLFIIALLPHTDTLTPTNHFTGGLTFAANNILSTVALLSLVFFFFSSYLDKIKPWESINKRFL